MFFPTSFGINIFEFSVRAPEHSCLKSLQTVLDQSQQKIKNAFLFVNGKSKMLFYLPFAPLMYEFEYALSRLICPRSYKITTLNSHIWLEGNSRFISLPHGQPSTSFSGYPTRQHALIDQHKPLGTSTQIRVQHSVHS